MRQMASESEVQELQRLADELDSKLKSANVALGVVCFARAVEPLNQIDYNSLPETRRYLDCQLLVVNDRVREAIRKFRTTDNLEELDNETKQIAYDLAGLSVALFEKLARNLITMAGVAREDLRVLESNLGFDKARIYALEMNTEYVVSTENSQYLISYNEDFEFTLKKIQGTSDKQPPDFLLKFIGNVQDDGTIFAAGYDLPVISTGDRLLFSKAGEDEQSSPPKLAYVTSRVISAIKKSEIN